MKRCLVWTWILSLSLVLNVSCGAHGAAGPASSKDVPAVQPPFRPFKPCPGTTICASRPAKTKVRTSSGSTSMFYLPYIFYRDVVSPSDGPRCHHYPTCSMYAMQAVRRRGPLVGALMALDRITSAAGISSAIRDQPTYLHHGTLRYLDPIEANDFWMDDP